MLFRNCSGGVVFNGDSVFLLQNDKSEWVLPKGVIRNGSDPEEVAIRRVREECGVDAQILCPAGATSYEFYSISRKKPVCNEITWYIMTANSDQYAVNTDEGFLDGGFFPFEESVERITYSQDKSLLRMSYERYREEVGSRV